MITRGPEGQLSSLPRGLPMPQYAELLLTASIYKPVEIF